MFKYPMKDKDTITLKVTDGTDINGNPKVIQELVCVATFIGMTKTRFDSSGHQITISGTIFKKGDILPDVNNITGLVIYDGITYTIFKFQKIKDPFGKVHHIEIEVS